jgi:hypothetical protein
MLVNEQMKFHNSPIRLHTSFTAQNLVGRDDRAGMKAPGHEWANALVDEQYNIRELRVRVMRKNT